MLNHQDFQRDNHLSAYDQLRLHPEQPEKTPPLMKAAVLQKHQVVGVQWMLEMESGLAGGGLLADVSVGFTFFGCQY
jgi:SNF2 family DNA or RNA helicase